MAIHYITLKRCSRKTQCCNPLGSWLPETSEYFSKKKRCRNGLSPICKICGAAYTRNWVKDNPQKKRAADKHYAETHREQVRESSRRAYWKNPEKARERSRNWNEKHLEQRRSINRDWNRRNKSRVTLRIREWRRAFPEKAQAAKDRRRALEHNAKGSHTADDIRLLRKTQPNCWWCGKSVGSKYHVDHRIPLARGGSNAPENLCISCPQCNQSKNDKLPAEWSDRLL